MAVPRSFLNETGDRLFITKALQGNTLPSSNAEEIIMKNELLHIGPLTLYGYGLMIGLGILAAWILGRNPDQLFSMILWILLGGFAGAKLLFLLTQWKNLMQYPSLLRYYLSDGFVVFGESSAESQPASSFAAEKSCPFFPGLIF